MPVQHAEPVPSPPGSSGADGTAGALRHLAATVAVLAVAVTLTYATPGLERFRPWNPGDPVPLASIAKRWGADPSLPAFAGAGSGYQAPTRVRESVAAQLGDSVAANLGEAAGAAPSEGQAPVTQRAPAPEPSGVGPDPHAAPPAVHIDPSEYDGIEVEIEDPTGRGMAPFYDALLRTAQREPGALTRAAHYGDSSIATDLITHTVRRRLQERFGDGGHGFLLVARGHMPWGHRDVEHRANAEWRLKELVRSQDSDGLYGYGGVQYLGVPGARAVFGTREEGPVGERVSRFELYYHRARRGGIVQLQVDDDEPIRLDTRVSEGDAGDAFLPIDVPDGAHELELRVRAGRPMLYGMVLEREGPGVVYDSLGMVGARARRLLNFDEAHIRRQLAHRGVDLLILGFGGNEADDRLSRMTNYEEEFRRVIRRMRGDRRDMACLVFAPLDQAHRNRYGRIVTMETIPFIVEAQKKAARAEGCAFYNTYEAMGGEGAMHKWYRARPRLAMGDFRHATPAGYEVIGNMFYKALLKGFAEHLDER